MRTCKSCKAKFDPNYNTMQKACSVRCALDLAKHDKERKRKAETRQMRSELRENDRSYWMKAAQTEFNKWVRLRDKDLACISCGRHHQGQYHAGHYRTRGANPELSLEPLNCHKQCAPCNNHKSGDIVNYRINLVNRIGQDKVDWLEGPHKPKKYTIADLKEIRAHYKALIKSLSVD